MTFGVKLDYIAAFGISAMMHGYLVFDEQGKQLVPFRTWRNTNAEEAGRKLSAVFDVNIPIRWSISQLYQSVLDSEPHVSSIRYLTTLSGYIHWKLTGRKVLGIGDASGIFPIDSGLKNYNNELLDRFDSLVHDKGYPWTIREILPQILCAGEKAGSLTEEGARYLDPSGKLKAGIPLVPPEGDAGTGMVATNSVAPKTGNVSAGTSIFAMLTLEKPLSRQYSEVDIVATPSGSPVAMVHSNNCTSELDAWVRVFQELLNLTDTHISKSDLYDKLYQSSLQGDLDCDGVIVYNYLSGEPVTGVLEGRPMVVRGSESLLTLGNFMRAHLYSAVATLRIGMDILNLENVTIDRLMGHGGLFKTLLVGQKVLADALGIPVSVMLTAAEGGAYGIALLAAYGHRRKAHESLENYLEKNVFGEMNIQTIEPNPAGVEGFRKYLISYIRGLYAERAAGVSI